MPEAVVANVVGTRECWQEVTFDACAKNVTDRIDDPSTAGVERYVGLEHLDSGRTFVRRWGSPADVESTKLRFLPGDVIFGKRRAYQRKLGQVDFAGICSAHAMVLRPNPEVVLPDFLPYFLESEAFMQRAVAISVGSLSPTINWRALASQVFRVPPKPEQSRIARIMGAFETTASKLETAASRSLDALGSLAGDVFGDEHEFATCATLTSQITVGIVVKPAQWYTEDGVPALRSLNVGRNSFDLSDLVQLTEAGHAHHKKSELRLGDVVVVRTGRPGDAAVANREVEGMNCIDLIIARCSPNLDPHFLAYYLNSGVARRRMAGRFVGTAQQHFNVTSLKQLPAPVLPPEAQRAAVDVLSSVELLRQEIAARLTSVGLSRRRCLAELLPDVH